MEGQDFLSNVTVFNGLPQAPQTIQQGPGELVSSGATLLQSKTQYHTAIAVQKPRDLDKCVVTIMKEAAYAGEDWYYSWSVKSKDGRKQLVEGGSIGLAMSMAREWGNAVVDVEYEIITDHDVFTARFVDLERGTTFTRVYKQRRKAVVGKYDADRWEDMEFQKAQSKALRNVILAALPKWLQKAAIEEAKKGVISAIERVGISRAKEMAVDFLAGYGVEMEQIEGFLRKKKDAWTTEDIAKLRGAASQLKDGQASAEELFPAKSEQKPEIKETPTHETKPDSAPTQGPRQEDPPVASQPTAPESEGSAVSQSHSAATGGAGVAEGPGRRRRANKFTVDPATFGVPELVTCGCTPDQYLALQAILKGEDATKALEVKKALGRIGQGQVSFFRHDEAEELLRQLQPAAACRPADTEANDTVECIESGEQVPRSHCLTQCQTRQRDGFCPMVDEMEGGVI